MDYSKWPERSISVVTTLLDQRNPRIPPSDEPFTQRDLLAELVFHDKVYELARNIVTNGYYPVESLIVIRVNNKLTVVEGNRRLAALKLLCAPEAAPEEFKARFTSLSNRIDKVTIKKVKVVISPNREAAAPIIMSRHTERQIERWETINQSSFYAGLIRDGVTIENLAREYNVPIKKIIDSLRLYDMYNVACNLNLPDEITDIVRNPREFKATTLQRFYERPISQDFLGIKISPETPNIEGFIEKSEFQKGYKKIVTDIAKGDMDSRIIGTTKKVKKYIDGIKENVPQAQRPNHKKKGFFNTDSLLHDYEIEPEGAPAKRKAPRARPKKPPLGLIPSSFSCDVSSQRIIDIVGELQRIPVGKGPNATAVLLRILLELALAHYLDRSGDLYTIIEEEKQRLAKINRPFNKNWHPTLKPMLKYVIAPERNIIQNPHLRSALDKFTNRRDEPMSQDDMNQFVHNRFMAPNEQALRGYWAQLENLFKIILVEETAD